MILVAVIGCFSISIAQQPNLDIPADVLNQSQALEFFEKKVRPLLGLPFS
jgi:hypothetical protein